MLVALMSTPDRWPSGSPHAQIKVIVVELAARARDRAGEAGHECRFAGEELVALVERLIDKITIPISVCSPRTRGDTTKATTQKELAYFNPLPSCEGRLADLSRSHYCFRFQSTPLMRGETPSWRSSTALIPFQSTPLMRGETRACKATLCDTSFQSTPLMRGETAASSAREVRGTFQSTPLMRGETKLYTGSGRGEEFQSTPLMRGETKNRVLTLDEIRISIHSPHARGDTIYRFRFLVSSYFNPLLSLIHI